jgi:hypothetical protein
MMQVNRLRTFSGHLHCKYALALPDSLWHNNITMSRWIRFFLAILIGISLGLLYGWVISPIKYVDTAPDTLRVDYKTDYVLMVAEAYRGDNNLDLAMRRLALLGNTAPVDIVSQSVTFAQKAGYTDADLNLIQTLLSSLQANNITRETSAP